MPLNSQGDANLIREVLDDKHKLQKYSRLAGWGGAEVCSISVVHKRTMFVGCVHSRGNLLHHESSVKKTSLVVKIGPVVPGFGTSSFRQRNPMASESQIRIAFRNLNI